jgi:hypothetical protein
VAEVSGDGYACTGGCAPPQWNHLPEDLRRLLADTADRVAAGEDGAVELHQRAHVLAAEYRSTQRRRAS